MTNYSNAPCKLRWRGVRTRDHATKPRLTESDRPCIPALTVSLTRLPAYRQARVEPAGLELAISSVLGRCSTI